VLYRHFIERWVHALSRDVGLSSSMAQQAEAAVNSRSCYWHTPSAHSTQGLANIPIEVVRCWPGVVVGNSMLAGM